MEHSRQSSLALPSIENSHASNMPLYVDESDSRHDNRPINCIEFVYFNTVHSLTAYNLLVYFLEFMQFGVLTFILVTLFSYAWVLTPPPLFSLDPAWVPQFE